MAILLQGMSEFVTALKAASTAVDLATKAATAKAAHLLEAEIKTKLGQSSHQKRTPTPSRPGQPPALVTGTLRRSVKVEGPTSLGAGTYQARVGPTAVYGRVQELGGDTGTTVLPSRPYVQPALKELRDSSKLSAVYLAAWRASWGVR